jgi:hypothetical protein
MVKDAVHHGVPEQEAPVHQVAVKPSVPELPSRVAAAISTSAGELTRVGAWAVLKVGGPDVRPAFESRGNTWYNSTSTLLIFVRGAFKGINPVMVARLLMVVYVRTKSSAVSVLDWAGTLGQRPEPTVRFTGAEEKSLRPSGRREPHPKGQRGCY